MSSQSDLVGGEQNVQTVQPSGNPGKDKKCRELMKKHDKLMNTHVGDEQNDQTVQPLITDQNDRNVKSLVTTKTKRARNPGKDKKYRANKKLKTENMERELEKTRADHAELKGKYDELKNTYHAGSVEKLHQMETDMEPIRGRCSTMQQVFTPQHASINMLQPLWLDLMKKDMELELMKKDMELMKKDMELMKKDMELMKQVVTQQHASINMLQQPLLVAGTINQFGATTESGGPVFEGLFPQSHQVEQAYSGLTYGGLTYGGDLNYTSPLGATMASGSWAMHGSLAPGGQAQGNNSEQPTDQFPGVN